MIVYIVNQTFLIFIKICSLLWHTWFVNNSKISIDSISVTSCHGHVYRVSELVIPIETVKHATFLLSLEHGLLIINYFMKLYEILFITLVHVDYSIFTFISVKICHPFNKIGIICGGIIAFSRYFFNSEGHFKLMSIQVYQVCTVTFILHCEAGNVRSVPGHENATTDTTISDYYSGQE